MPSPKSVKKGKIRARLKLTPSRLVKTNGRFSKGKLATIVVSFAAIGVLVISLTHAWSYQDVVTWQMVSDTVHHTPWYDTRFVECGNPDPYCNVNLGVDPPHQFPSGDIVWWGPYHRLGIPSPTGMNDQICANVSSTSGTVNYTLEVTALFGKTLLASANQSVSSVLGTNWTLRCSSIHVPPSIAGYWDAVEYRVRIRSATNFYDSLPMHFGIGQVGLFQ